MKRDLLFISAQPDDFYYLWQVHTWLESLKQIGCSDKAISLVFTPADREPNPQWQQLVDLYPESKFFFQRDEDRISRFLGLYIPILRPYVLSKYFHLHPELKEKAIFYCDADVVFTKYPDIDKFLEDDINYLSDTKSYISASYFDSKVKDVLPERLEEYKKRDILNEITWMTGISREIAEKNEESSGGAQYLLKNIDGAFWDKVFEDCLVIRQYLMTINTQFFGSENKGFQSWCSDMWAVLWGLWRRNQETQIVPEMKFAWSSDSIEKLDNVSILHNAGIAGEYQGDIPVFY